MRNAIGLKTCSSGMFERLGVTSNRTAKCEPESVRAKNIIAGVTYGSLEHGGFLFEPNVREKSLLLEHHPTTLIGGVYVRQGGRFGLPFLRRVRTDDVPPAQPLRSVRVNAPKAASALMRANGPVIGQAASASPSPKFSIRPAAVSIRRLGVTLRQHCSPLLTSNPGGRCHGSPGTISARCNRRPRLQHGANPPAAAGTNYVHSL